MSAKVFDVDGTELEKGDKVTLRFTDADGDTVTEEKTVRMLLPEKNAIVFHHDRELVKFPTVEGDSGSVESKFGTHRGFDPELVDIQSEGKDDSADAPVVMADGGATVDEPEYQETQRAAGEIEREVAGVLTETNRQEISIEFDGGSYLPPEAVDIAQRHGFKLHAVFGKHAKFRPDERT